MNRYEQLIALLQAVDTGRPFYGHSVVEDAFGKFQCIVPVFGSGEPLEPSVIKFIQRCFGAE